MTHQSTAVPIALIAVVAAIALALSACGDGGLTRAEVEEIVREELAAQPQDADSSAAVTSAEVEEIVNDAIAATARPEPGLTRAEVVEIVRAALAEQSQAGASSAAARADVEEIVNDAIAALPRPEPGLTRAEVVEIVRAALASVPSRSAPADYTRHVVANAIARYEAQGLDATLAHYNSPQSVDGQWYVFIIDENDLVIGHPDPERLGLDLKGWVGTDANGYEFGPEMLSATEEGKWVSYVYRNPESGGIGTGDFELKNAWVMKHDGLLFGSGWYIDADEFTRMLVFVAVEKYREAGLAGTIAYFASPGSALAGLEEAIAYYNAAETVDGQWFAFIGGPDGTIVGHSDVTLIGGDVEDLLGGVVDLPTAEGEGIWVESESLRVFVAGTDGYVFGSGWSRDAPGN